MPSYAPSPRDIIHVSALLSRKSLPPELITLIIEEAEYWARITTKRTLPPDEEITAHGNMNENTCILKAKPISAAAADEGHFVSDKRLPVGDGDGDEAAGSSEAPGEGVIARTLDRVVAGVKALAVTAGIGNGGGTDAAISTEGMGSWGRYYSALPATSIPEPRLKHPVRRITWKMRSHDQGWGGEGGADEYENSWTGFRGTATRIKSGDVPEEKVSDPHDSQIDEVGAGSEDKPIEDQTRREDAGGEEEIDFTNRESPPESDTDLQEIWPKGDWCFKDVQIQMNRRANAQWKTHCVVWDYRDDIEEDDPMAVVELSKQGRGQKTGNGSLVRMLWNGDVVRLWSYAFFPGWAIYVQEVEVIIEFAL